MRPVSDSYRVLMLSAAVWCAASSPHAQAQTATVYKHVDAQGRVTYSNAPIKGGAVVELPPLTVIPFSPMGSLNEPKAAAKETKETKEAKEAKEAKESATAVPAATREPLSSTGKETSVAVPVARVTTVPPLPGNGHAATAAQTAAQSAQQRREDVRRRILEGEIDAEAQLLVDARAQLEEEQSRSNVIRAMRASLSQPSSAPSGAVETKAAIERHFERVRDLQDQIAMHQQNLADLRSQLKPATVARAGGGAGLAR